MDASPTSPEGDLYFERLLELASQYPELDYLAEPVVQDPRPITRVCYGGSEITGGPSELLQRHASRPPNSRRPFCIVENVTPEWIKAVGPAWGLDARFFIQFMTTAGNELDWVHVLENEDAQIESIRHNALSTDDPVLSDLTSPPPPFWTIRGVFYLKDYDVSDLYSNEVPSWVRRDKCNKTSRTCLSYYNISDLDLFLVDATPAAASTLSAHGSAHPDSDIMASICCGIYSKGIQSVQEVLLQYLFLESRRRDFQLMHRYGGKHRRDFIFIALATSSLRCYYEGVRRDVFHLSFYRIRQPNGNLSDELHNHRQVLAWARFLVSHFVAFIQCCDSKDQKTYREASEAQDSSLTRSLHLTNPKADLDDFLAEIQAQENLVAQSFQILLASISIKESQVSIQQSRRGVLLTWLAFIYAPLTFVTGIFGMNLSEINNARYSAWMFGVILIVVLVSTLCIFLAYKAWEKWSSRLNVPEQLAKTFNCKEKIIAKDAGKLV